MKVVFAVSDEFLRQFKRLAMYVRNRGTCP